MLSLNWERDFWKKAAAKQVFIYLQDHRLCLELCKKVVQYQYLRITAGITNHMDALVVKPMYKVTVALSSYVYSK